MYRDNFFAHDVAIFGFQVRVYSEVFHAAKAAKHELIHSFADLNHGILEPCADLLFCMPHEHVMQYPDDCAERDHGHQQKSEYKFFGQGHGSEFHFHCKNIFIYHYFIE